MRAVTKNELFTIIKNHPRFDFFDFETKENSLHKSFEISYKYTTSYCFKINYSNASEDKFELSYTPGKYIEKDTIDYTMFYGLKEYFEKWLDYLWEDISHNSLTHVEEEVKIQKTIEGLLGDSKETDDEKFYNSKEINEIRESIEKFKIKIEELSEENESLKEVLEVMKKDVETLKTLVATTKKGVFKKITASKMAKWMIKPENAKLLKNVFESVKILLLEN